MFFRASMDSEHGTSTIKLADWPRSDCQPQPPPLSLAVHSTTAVAANAPPLLVKREIPQYSTKFEPFVLRPDNKILVEDGSSRDSSSTMLKVPLLHVTIMCAHCVIILILVAFVLCTGSSWK
jgi:hypothetical protein